MERMKYIAILLALTLTSCATSGTMPSIPVEYTPHPVEPSWVQFTRKPVISSTTEDGKKNFKVSDEFVEKALQSNDYIKRVKKWKEKNLVP